MNHFLLLLAFLEIVFVSGSSAPQQSSSTKMKTQHERETNLPASGARCRVANLNSDTAVILTHPWGPLGGNMHNNVVLSASMFFQSLGVTTLRFDFSTSQISRGYKEVKQVVEAAEFLLSGQHIDNSTSNTEPKQQQQQQQQTKKQSRAPRTILLVGYSYGSLITGSASASIPSCIGTVSIAPPVSVKHWLLLFNSGYHVSQAQKRKDLPRLMVIGTEDNFSTTKSFTDYVDSFPDKSTSGALMKQADHFFNGYERDLMNVIGQWLLSTYSEALGGDLKRLGQADLSKLIEQQQGTEEDCGDGTS